MYVEASITAMFFSDYGIYRNQKAACIHPWRAVSKLCYGETATLTTPCTESAGFLSYFGTNKTGLKPIPPLQMAKTY